MQKILLSMLGMFFVMSAYAAPAPTGAPPAVPATPPAGSPPSGVNTTGTRYDWQGNFKKAQSALIAKDFKTAIQLFTEILNSGRLPKVWLPTTLYLRGKAYRSSGQFKQAVTDYEAAIQADSNLDPAYYELGATYHSLGQYGKAIEAFSRAISLKPGMGNYYEGRCTSYAWMNRYNEAIRDCEVAIKSQPRNANLVAFLGRLYEEAGQKQRAIELYKLALSINPNQSDAREGLAQLTK
ncbi:MAG: tetratricopeptide repeat protein [Micropepsaceae bacterium]